MLAARRTPPRIQEEALPLTGRTTLPCLALELYVVSMAVGGLSVGRELDAMSRTLCDIHIPDPITTLENRIS